MQPQIISGRHFATRELIEIRCRDGIVTAISPSSRPLAEDVWIAPALVDLQINGYAGVDFQNDDLAMDELIRATRELRAAGCTRFLFTLITDHWPRLLARLSRARAMRDQSEELRSAIAGWHIEGPFLSPVPGFCGAHNPECMMDPTPAHIRELRAIAGSDPLLITVAPERSGAIEAIALAVSLGMKVSLGHTNASAETLARAVRAGTTGFTHLANGCPKDLDRHDNILWRVFETPGLTVSLIPDCIHVSPALFRLMHRVLNRESIYYTTDAMSAAGAPPGRYKIGQLELEVGADQIVRLPGKTNFAGSALRPIDGIFRAAQMLGRPWQEVWDGLSAHPASFMSLPIGLAVGLPAHFCVILAKQNELTDLKVCSPICES